MDKKSFTMQDELELSIYFSDQMTPILPLMQDWAEREFLNYPYLWSPPKGEIFTAFSLYANEKNSMVAVVRHQGKVVGIAAGLAFDCESIRSLFEGLRSPSMPPLFEQVKLEGFDPSRILYMSFFLTDPDYHNDPRLVSSIYDRFVDFAHSIGKNQICYFEDLGDPNSPLKPVCPVPIEPWNEVIDGFRSMNIQLDITWETLQLDGSVKDEVHTSEFFIKDI